MQREHATHLIPSLPIPRPAEGPFRFDDANFHVFGLLWNQTHVRYFADGLPVGAAMPAQCFQQAIGIDFDRETMPTWMGLPGADFDRDRPFEIDYVRAWKTR